MNNPSGTAKATQYAWLCAPVLCLLAAELVRSPAEPDYRLAAFAATLQPPAAIGATVPAAPMKSVRAELASSASLVTTQRGTLPIILTAPHGGVVRMMNVPDRTRGVTVLDDRTAELTLLIAQRLTGKLGAKPYFVVAQFSRKHADANRNVAEGTEHPHAAREHAAFHDAVAQAVSECKAKFGRAILIDIHGQSRVTGSIVRGTRNTRTVSQLLARSGQQALIGPDSVCGRLRSAGYDMLPKSDDPEQAIGRETFFDGGYIVATYGGDAATQIDAIQLEFGRMRIDNTMKLARDVGDAIAAFARTHGYAGDATPALPAAGDAASD